MTKFSAAIGLAVAAVILIVVLGIILAFPVMWLVNYLFTPAVLTAVFGVGAISLWQAWALNILCGLLFKSKSS